MNTEERIQKILNEIPTMDRALEEIIRLELEALVIRAQLDQLQKEK